MTALNHFFINQALHLRDGRIDLLIRPYAVPLVVILPTSTSHVSVLPTRREVESFFVAKFDGLRSVGIDYLRAKMSWFETVTPRRHKARVVWDYIDQNGRRAGETHATYFMSHRLNGLTVEMVEFTKLAFPAIADWVEDYDRRVPWVQSLH